MKKSEAFTAIEKTVERLFLDEERGPGLQWYSVRDLEAEKEGEELLKRYDEEYQQLFGDNFENVGALIYLYYCEVYHAEKLPAKLEELEIQVLDDLSSHNEYSRNPPKIPAWLKDRAKPDLPNQPPFNS